MPQPTARRRIKSAQVQFLSLCKRGKNRMPVIYKADGSLELQTIVKAGKDFDERGELLAVVYAPEFPDTDGDVASAEVIRKMAYDFQKRVGQIDIQHDLKAVSRDAAFVAENFIIQKGDPRFENFTDYENRPFDPTGGWGVVIQVDDPKLRKSFRDNEWNGLSLFGPAELENEPSLTKADDEGANWLRSFLSKVFHPLPSHSTPLEDEIDMKPEELTKAITDANKPLLDAIAALAPAKKPATKPTEDAVVFKGDPADRAAVKRHLAKLRKAQAAKEIDWNDPEAVEEHLGSIEKSIPDDDEDPIDEDHETEQLRKENETLRKQLDRRGGRSNQPAGDRQPLGEQGGNQEDISLSKGEQDLFKAGRSLGERWNKVRAG